MGITVPVEADSVAPPVIFYKADLIALDFLAADEVTWWRTSFEKLDSLRVSRGEYEPYPSAQTDKRPWRWVSIVEGSSWLRERYEYEKENYADQYDWGEDVKEMLSEFDHYVFSFHDEFVEVIARGIWFELAEGWTPDRVPLSDLSGTVNVEKREAHGLAYRIISNPKPLQKLIEDSKLCSQNLIQFATDLDGNDSIDWSLTLRSRKGKVVSTLRSYFGKAEETYDGVATVSQVLPIIEKWLQDVVSGRREMGKD